jgi:transposase-like protein
VLPSTAITRERAAQGKSDKEIRTGSRSYVVRELYGALSVCGLTYRSVPNGQVANRPIHVAFGVTTRGERGILGFRAGVNGYRTGR